MIEFLFDLANYPFIIALMVMVFLAITEGVFSLIGSSLSDAWSHLFAEPAIDTPMDALSGGHTGFVTQTLSWLRIGTVPFVFLLVIFLTLFGLIGLGLQFILNESLAWMLPSVLASFISLFISLPLVRFFGGLLFHFMPQDETQAVSTASFIGFIATITLGESRSHYPAQGKLKDSFGTTHYVMIEPDNEDDILAQGSEVLIVRHVGSIFYAIPNDHAAMQKQ